MIESLSSEQIQAVKGLFALSPNFRDQFGKLVKSEIDKAQALVSQLEKLNVGENESNEVKPAPKKRGRPAGSKNSKPSKPRVKQEKVTNVPAPTVETMHHKDAISAALLGSPDGLSAGDILESIIRAKHKKYVVPARNVLYTTLNGMKSKNLVKMTGNRPNTKYVLP